MNIKRCSGQSHVFLLLIIMFTFLPFCLLSREAQVTYYIDCANRDFELLLIKANESRQKFWKNERFQRTLKRSRWLQEWEAEETENKKDPSYKEISSSRTYEFFREYDAMELSDVTYLVDGIGQEIINSSCRIISLTVDTLKTKLKLLNGHTSDEQMRKLINDIMNIESETETCKNDPPLKIRYLFAPKNSAWDETPKVIAEYKLHDWEKAIEQIKSNELQLIKVKKQLTIEEFLYPRDKKAWISWVTQIAILLIALAAHMISYIPKPPRKILLSIVIIGMCLSIVLTIFFSNTLINTLLPPIIQGGFILFYAMQKNRI